MNCDKYKQLITDRLAGELTPEQDKLLTLHLKQCDSCRKYASEIEKLWANMAQTFSEDGAKPEKMTQARLDAIRSEFNSYIDTTNAGDEHVITFREQHKRRFVFHAIAACVVCVLIAVVVLSENKKSEPEKVSDIPKAVAEKTPEAVAENAPEAVAENAPEAVAEKAPEAVAVKNLRVVKRKPVVEKKNRVAADFVTAVPAEAPKKFPFPLPDNMPASDKHLFRHECGVVMSPFVPDTIVGCSVVNPGKRLKGDVKQEFIPVKDFAVTPVHISAGNAVIFTYQPVEKPLPKKNNIQVTLPNGWDIMFPIMETEWYAYEKAPTFLQQACLIHALSDRNRYNAILKDPEMRKKVLAALEDLQKYFAKDPTRFPFNEEYKQLKAAE